MEEKNHKKILVLNPKVYNGIIVEMQPKNDEVIMTKKIPQLVPLESSGASFDENSKKKSNFETLIIKADSCGKYSNLFQFISA